MKYVKYIKITALMLSAVIFTFLMPSCMASPAHEAYAIYSVEDKELLYGVDTDVHVAPASLAKLLTAVTALKYIEPDTVLTVGTEQELVPSKSSLCLILEGHQLTLYDLISGMLMVSGNDAAYTVAVSTARAVKGDETLSDSEAVEYFCKLMNDMAAELGMKDSHFTTPDGFDSEEQYTTVSDLLLLAEYAMTIPEIREIASTPERYVVFHSGENITWVNSNKLLDTDSGYYCEDAVGLKTGTTVNAGNCLIAAFERDNKMYISVVVGCGTDGSRYSKTLEMYSDYVIQ